QRFAAACIAALVGLTSTAWAQGRPGQDAPPDRYTIIHAGTLLAVPGEPAQKEMTVVVKNDRVDRTVTGYATAASLSLPETTTVIDLKERFVLPGLMDAHVHLRSQPSDFARGQGVRRGRATPLPADMAVNAMIYARRTINAGFTTVRDLGSDDQSVFAVREAINTGRMVGPRILASGAALSATGGHADGSVVTGDQLTARLMDGVCDGPDECMRAVRFQHKLGADLIKFTATGGFASTQTFEQQLFFPEMKAIIDAAHQLDMRVAVHAYTPNAIADAVKAGANSIEHGFFVDDATLKLMKEKGTFLVPTLSAAYPPPFLGIKDPPSVRMRNEAKAFERAYARGVKIAFGTDAGTFNHAENAKEFGYMIEFGMTPMDAIKAATVMTADLFGLKDVGTLKPGNVADIIAVAGDPLSDVKTLQAVDFVMKSGTVAKRNGAIIDGFSYPAFGSDRARR
ncbi:MAG: amidohydrolase family protein, partial [Rhodospirillaceae bacterium]|nr:amidohydrolase family protein [Rhodospirillaceae bacterium]